MDPSSLCCFSDALMKAKGTVRAARQSIAAGASGANVERYDAFKRYLCEDLVGISERDRPGPYGNLGRVIRYQLMIARHFWLLPQEWRCVATMCNGRSPFPIYRDRIV